MHACKSSPSVPAAKMPSDLYNGMKLLSHYKDSVAPDASKQ